MKKNILVGLITFLVITGLLVCKITIFPTDDSHASLSVINSTGEVALIGSYNDLNRTWSAERMARLHSSNFKIKDGETITLHFECLACGNEQDYTVTDNWAKLIHCDCPDEGDDDGNAKEYVAVKVVKY